MKKLLICISIFVCLFVFSIPAFADSPVTSTQFSDAYQDISIVKEASEQGIVNAKIAAYLSNAKNPIDVKAAVINALSWEIEGKSNTELYSKEIYKTSVSKLKIESLSGDQLFCIGYMMAMDNYLETAPALKYLKSAEKKINNSFTVSVVRAIVEAQDSSDNIWKYIEPLLQNNSLKRDMRENGINIILDYMACESFAVSQNNLLLESEKSQKVFLYGAFDIEQKSPYQIVSPSDKAYTSLGRDQYGIYYLNITGVINGNSSIQIKNNMDQSITVNLDVVSSDTYNNINNVASMYIGSTKALIGKTKSTVISSSIPYLKNDKQYVPIDFVNKAIGAKMQFDKKKGIYNITYAGKTISVRSASNVVSINGKTTKLSSKIETKNKMLFISAQDFATITGKKYVYYDGLILFADSKGLLDTIKNDYILDEISTLLNDGKSILNYPIAFKENEKFGYKDTAGKVIVKPIYDDALEFNEGLAVIALKDDQGVMKYGFIDVKGNVVIKPIYDWAHSFGSGLAPVTLDGRAGFIGISKSGAIKVGFEYGGVGYFSGGLAPVMDIESNKWGYIDTTGKLVIPYKYDDCRIFSEGLAAVKVSDKWGFIDRTGKLIIQPSLGETGDFLNGTVLVELIEGYYSMNKSGKYCLFFDNKDIYVGDLKNDKMDGKGIYTWADGMQYSGDCLENQFTGKGIFTFPDGTILDGDWKNGEYIENTK